MQYGPWRAKSGAAQREGKVLSQKTNKQKSFIRSSSERAQGKGEKLVAPDTGSFAVLGERQIDLLSFSGHPWDILSKL